MSDSYILQQTSYKRNDIVDRYGSRHKRIAIIYLPDEILTKMKWTDSTPLVLSVEKDALRITENKSGEDVFFTNELLYEPLDEDEL